MQDGVGFSGRVNFPYQLKNKESTEIRSRAHSWTSSLSIRNRRMGPKSNMDERSASEKARASGSSARRVMVLVIMYATCSSSLSIVNKWAILALPFPSIVTACQFLSTAGSVWLFGQLGFLEVEALETRKMIRMAPINIVFYLAIFTNGKVLQYSTVETFIAFRSLTPLLVSGLDTIVRGEPPPSFRTMLTLFAIAFGAASYAYDDVNFSILGYSWALAYLVIIVTEMVYAKHVTSTIGLSTWGLVLYQNTIAIFLFPIASIITGEMREIITLSSKHYHTLFAQATDTTSPEEEEGNEETNNISYFHVFLPLVVSCVLGLGISFSAWGTRSTISATQFTVLGVACKLATVGINAFVWHHHAPLLAQVSIVMCIIASVLYQQSAKRDKELQKLQQIAIPIKGGMAGSNNHHPELKQQP